MTHIIRATHFIFFKTSKNFDSAQDPLIQESGGVAFHTKQYHPVAMHVFLSQFQYSVFIFQIYLNLFRRMNK